MQTDLFKDVNQAALPHIRVILDRLGVKHQSHGRQIQMLNPLRADTRFGSFSINERTGTWKEFATGDGGSDPVSLVAYLQGQKQGEAAKDLASMFGVSA